MYHNCNSCKANTIQRPISGCKWRPYFIQKFFDSVGSSGKLTFTLSWFWVSAAMFMRSALFWDITRRCVVIVYRRFGTTYRSHLQVSRVAWTVGCSECYAAKQMKPGKGVPCTLFTICCLSLVKKKRTFMWRPRVTVYHLISATKPFVRFSWNSV
jgi:hypothetical protein